MAPLVGVATDLRAILAAHVSFQFVDRRRLRPAHDVQGDGLVSIATEASDFKNSVAGVFRASPTAGDDWARLLCPGMRSRAGSIARRAIRRWTGSRRRPRRRTTL